MSQLTLRPLLLFLFIVIFVIVVIIIIVVVVVVKNHRSPKFIFLQAELAQRLLSKEPVGRPSAAEVRDHELFRLHKQRRPLPDVTEETAFIWRHGGDSPYLTSLMAQSFLSSLTRCRWVGASFLTSLMRRPLPDVSDKSRGSHCQQSRWIGDRLAATHSEMCLLISIFWITKFLMYSHIHVQIKHVYIQAMLPVSCGLSPFLTLFFILSYSKCTCIHNVRSIFHFFQEHQPLSFIAMIACKSCSPFTAKQNLVFWTHQYMVCQLGWTCRKDFFKVDQ